MLFFNELIADGFGGTGLTEAALGFMIGFSSDIFFDWIEGITNVLRKDDGTAQSGGQQKKIISRN